MKKILLGGLVGVVATVPMIASISCSSNDDQATPGAAKSDEELLHDQMQAAQEEAQANREQVQSRINSFAANAASDTYIPSVSMSGSTKFMDDLVADFMASDYEIHFTDDGLTVKCVETKIENGKLIGKFEVSDPSTEGTTSAFYFEEIPYAHITSLSVDPVESAKQQLTIENFVPLLKSSSATKTVDELDPSDFQGKSTNGVEYRVVALSNPTLDGTVLVSVYAHSQLLRDLNDANVVFENVYDVQLTGLPHKQAGQEINDKIFDPVDWRELSTRNIPDVVWNGGVHRFALDQSLSMILNLARDLGEEDGDYARNTEQPTPEQIGDPSDPSDDVYSTDDQTTINGYNYLKNLQTTNNSFANANIRPWLHPLGDNTNPNGEDMNDMGLVYDTLSAPTDGEQDVMDTYTYGDLKNIGHYTSWLDWRTPGIIHVELEQAGTEVNHNSESYEWLFESQPEYAFHNYEIISLDNTPKYVNIIEKIFAILPELVQHLDEEMSAVPERRVSDDFVEALDYLATKTPSREWITEEFKKMNNGTFYWPAIEIFARGLVNVPEGFNGDRAITTRWTNELPGFLSIERFTQLLKWTSNIWHDGVGGLTPKIPGSNQRFPDDDWSVVIATDDAYTLQAPTNTVMKNNNAHLVGDDTIARYTTRQQ